MYLPLLSAACDSVALARGRCICELIIPLAYYKMLLITTLPQRHRSRSRRTSSMFTGGVGFSRVIASGIVA